MILKAIVKKELQSYKKVLTTRIVSLVGIIVFFSLFTYFRLLNTFNVDFITNQIAYSAILIGCMVFVSNLKFWYEKSMNMLETLFLLPTKLFVIILGKTILPILLSICTLSLFYVLLNIVISVKQGILTFSLVKLLLLIAFTVIFEISYSIINCYAMWCASMTFAKVIQFISFIIYMGAIFVVFVLPGTVDFLKSIPVWIALVIIFVYSLICYLKIDKEKALNTLYI